ncbi:MAG: hypothetical protein CL785_00365 [Chloroflexi bacterium]|nr:hypothetical protein [Chloroflexota bacterium]|tara:strand:- start:1777 stop:2967 length:1191 start_codon:yes stop_codon:yes gene_type:complete
MLKIFLWIWKTILLLIGINKNQSENNDTSSNQDSEDRIKILAYEVFREFQESQQAQFKTQQEAILAATQAQFKVQQESNNNDHAQRKALIDQQYESVVKAVRETQRVNVETNASLKHLGENISALNSHTTNLTNILNNSRARGQWGERLAEDILRQHGFIEGVNYTKQTGLEYASGRPDITFLLPTEQRLHMDVKFPFDNYMRYINAETDTEKGSFKSLFLTDVKNRIKEITSREYIDPGQSTLDYVIFFIPNDSVYTFISQEDDELFENARQSRVLCCSPSTILAVLGVVRQSLENFNFSQRADEMLGVIGEFKKQWDEFLKSMDTVGTRLDSTRKEFDLMVNRRQRALDRPVKKLETMRLNNNIPLMESSKEEEYNFIESEQAILDEQQDKESS